MIYLALILLIQGPSLHAKESPDYWYKVESKKRPSQEKKFPDRPNKDDTPPLPRYPFESVESKVTSDQHYPRHFWTRKPRLQLGAGFLYDKDFARDDHNRPWILSGGWTFLDRGWFRINIEGWLNFQSQFILNGALQWTPSRKALRSFYGVGLAHNWNSKSELRTLIRIDNYWITISYGYEYLFAKSQGIALEARGFIGVEDYGVNLMVKYIAHL